MSVRTIYCLVFVGSALSYSPSLPTCLIRFWIFLSSLLLLLPPHQHPFFVLTHIYTPVPNLLSHPGVSSTWPFLTPVTRQPPSLVSAPCSACLRLPPFPVSVHPPLFLPWPTSRSMFSPGGSIRRDALRLRVSLILPPYVLPHLL